jgi:hypothetical protein
VKRISLARSRDKLIHIETELGILNIRLGLHDVDGRKVESFQFIPDDRFAGDPIVRFRPGPSNCRFVQLKKRFRPHG